MKYLEMETIHSGHFDNLIYETSDIRIWRSRMTVEDGMPYDNQITVERLIDGKWEIVRQFDPSRNPEFYEYQISRSYLGR